MPSPPCSMCLHDGYPLNPGGQSQEVNISDVDTLCRLEQICGESRVYCYPKPLHLASSCFTSFDISLDISERKPGVSRSGSGFKPSVTEWPSR